MQVNKLFCCHFQGSVHQTCFLKCQAHITMAFIPMRKSHVLIMAIGVPLSLVVYSYLLEIKQFQPIYILSGMATVGTPSETLMTSIADHLLTSIRKDVVQCGAKKDNTLPMIYVITPTNKSRTQMPDLTRLAQTLMHVPSLTWLVVEDADKLDAQISGVLERSGIPCVHLFAPMPPEERKKKEMAIGVPGRNKGLEWLRNNTVDLRGVVYFADDDNTYDIRLFDEIRSVKKLGMWPVHVLAAERGVSAPIVRDGFVTGFYNSGKFKRKYPVDMAGYAFSVDSIFQIPNLRVPLTPGFEEDGFLRGFNMQLKDIEVKASNCTKIYVWRTETNTPQNTIKPGAHLNGTNVIALYKQAVNQSFVM